MKTRTDRVHIVFVDDLWGRRKIGAFLGSDLASRVTAVAHTEDAEAAVMSAMDELGDWRSHMKGIALVLDLMFDEDAFAGVRLLRDIRAGLTEMPFDIPVVVYSAHLQTDRAEKEAEFARLGVIDCIQKPGAEVIKDAVLAALRTPFRLEGLTSLTSQVDYQYNEMRLLRAGRCAIHDPGQDPPNWREEREALILARLIDAQEAEAAELYRQFLRECDDEDSRLDSIVAKAESLMRRHATREVSE